MKGFMPPDNAKAFAGIMYRAQDDLNAPLIDLENRLGRVINKSLVYDFTFTDYYEKEMGKGLKKFFLGFKDPINPEELAEIKVFTNSLETQYGEMENGAPRRRVNIDPGYLDKGKVVLASTKNRSQRIYLRDGVYAEVTLLYRDGSWQPLPWTYPDFKTPLAQSFFTELRNLKSHDSP